VVDITQDVFFPACGAAIQDLGGVYNPHYYNESYLPENSWQRLPDAIQARLGTSEWQVAAQDPPNETWIGAQYTGPDSTRRTLPILFHHVPFKIENGIQMFKVKFDQSTVS
jgi:hypothetical protein